MKDDKIFIRYTKSEPPPRAIRLAMWLVFLFWVVLLLGLFLIASQGICQAPLYFHDPTLDSINNNIANLGQNGLLGNDLPKRIFDTNFNGSISIVSNIPSSGFLDGYPTPGANQRTQTVVWGTGPGGASVSNQDLLKFSFTNFVGSVASNFVPSDGGGFASQLGTNNSEDAVDYLGSGNGDNWQLAIQVPTLHGSTFALLKPTIPEMFNHTDHSIDWLPVTCRIVIYALAWLMFGKEALDYLQKRVSDAAGQRQMQGSTEEILGNNASLIVGLAYAGVVTVAVGVFIGAVTTFPFFIHVGGMANSIFNQIDALANNIPAWYDITVWIPAWGLCTIWLYYIFFTRIIIWPLHMVVRSVMLWLAA